MIVLDTHILIWWINENTARLSTTAADAVETGLRDGGVCASAISAWEIAMLVKKDKLELSVGIMDWLALAGQVDGFHFIPIDNRIAVQSQSLPDDFHPDPADRIIVALARQLGAPLVTADRKIRNYPHVHTVW